MIDDVRARVSDREARRVAITGLLESAHNKTADLQVASDTDLLDAFRRIPDEIRNDGTFLALLLTDFESVIFDLGIELTPEYRRHIDARLSAQGYTRSRELFDAFKAGRRTPMRLQAHGMLLGAEGESRHQADRRALLDWEPRRREWADDERRRETQSVPQSSGSPFYTFSPFGPLAGVQVSESLLSRGLREWFAYRALEALLSGNTPRSIRYSKSWGALTITILLDFGSLHETRISIRGIGADSLLVHLPVRVAIESQSGPVLEYRTNLSRSGRMVVNDARGGLDLDLTDGFLFTPPGLFPNFAPLIMETALDWFDEGWPDIPIVKIQSSTFDISQASISKVRGQGKSGLSIGYGGPLPANLIDEKGLDELIAVSSILLSDAITKAEEFLDIARQIEDGGFCPDDGAVCLTGIPSVSPLGEESVQQDGMVWRVSGPASYKLIGDLAITLTYTIDVRVYCDDGVIREEVHDTDVEFDAVWWILAIFGGLLTGGALFGIIGGVVGGIAGAIAVGIGDAIADGQLAGRLGTGPLFESLEVGELAIDNEPACKVFDWAEAPAEFLITQFGG